MVFDMRVMSARSISYENQHILTMKNIITDGNYVKIVICSTMTIIMKNVVYHKKLQTFSQSQISIRKLAKILNH